MFKVIKRIVLLVDNLMRFVVRRLVLVFRIGIKMLKLIRFGCIWCVLECRFWFVMRFMFSRNRYKMFLKGVIMKFLILFKLFLLVRNLIINELIRRMIDLLSRILCIRFFVFCLWFLDDLLDLNFVIIYRVDRMVGVFIMVVIVIRYFLLVMFWFCRMEVVVIKVIMEIEL